MNRGPLQNRKRSAFKLTPREEDVLALMRSGKTLSEIALVLGTSRSSVGRQVVEATDKDRIRQLRDLKPERTTSLRRARGNTEKAE